MIDKDELVAALQKLDPSQIAAVRELLAKPEWTTRRPESRDQGDHVRARILKAGEPVTLDGTGTIADLSNKSLFDTLNFLGATPSVPATEIGSNAGGGSGGATLTQSTLVPLPTATMLVVSVFTGTTTIGLNTSATTVTFNGSPMTLLGKTSQVDGTEQLYGEVWYMISPSMTAAHNIVATFANTAITAWMGHQVFLDTTATAAPVLHTAQGIKATVPSLAVTDVSTGGAIAWEFGQRSAVGSAPNLQDFSPPATDASLGSGGQASLTQAYSIGNATVTGQASSLAAGTSAGMPWILFGVSMAQSASGSAGFTVSINADNKRQADIEATGGGAGSAGVNVDAIVDSNGNGDFLTLFGASGALQAMIATGFSRTIWICTTHTETQIASEVLVLAANQVITILSAGGTPVFLSGVSETRPTITIGHANPVMTFSTASGLSSKIVMKGYHYYRTVANAGHFINVTNGIRMPAITCEEMAFDSNTINGSWGHFIDARTDSAASGTLGDIRWRDVTYLGLSDSLSSVLSSIVATNSHTQFAQHMNIDDSIFQMTNLVFIDAGLTDVEPAVEQSYTGNRMTIVQTTATDSGYGLRDLRTGNVNCRGFKCNNNTITFKSAGAFYRTGIIAAAQDVEIVGNYFNANLGGGTSATNFAQIRADAGIAVNNVTITANTLIGPGSGTAINVESAFGAPAIASQFGINAFRNWTTNVGGTGALTTISGPVTFPGGGVGASSTEPYVIYAPAPSLPNAKQYINVSGAVPTPGTTPDGAFFYNTTTDALYVNDTTAWRIPVAFKVYLSLGEASVSGHSFP